MADLITTKLCPRKTALSGSSGTENKVGVLRGICKKVMLQLDLTENRIKVETLVDKEFDAAKTPMFRFENKYERERMVDRICSYLEFEQGVRRSAIVSKDFSHDVPFGKKTRTASAHVLIDRGDCLECIRYKYKKQEYSYNQAVVAKRHEAAPSRSPELLMLQRTGEAEAKKLGINKRVFGAIYYLGEKTRRDRMGNTIKAPFEDRVGDNIVNFNFDDVQANMVIDEYESVKSDIKIPACDMRICNECVYQDLCHLEFDKRVLDILPPERPTPIDKIYMTTAQRRFVEFRNGVCRVNAVAGSGKTTIIILRTLGMLEEDVDPSHILMLTFTDKAANEMRDRLTAYATGKSLTGEALPVEKVEVETFNSWGQHLLDKYYGELGFTRAPELVDDVRKKDIVIELLEAHDKLPLDYRNPFMSTASHQGAVVEMISVIDAMKASHVSSVSEAEAVLPLKLRPLASELLTVYQEYNKAMVKAGLIDYEDQLRLLLDLDRLGIFNKLEYEHIVVDEFQDSNLNQIDIINLITLKAPNFKSLAVVGDEMQSSVRRSCVKSTGTV